MRQITDYEKTQILASYQADALPTQAVTVEWEYYVNYQRLTGNGSGSTVTINQDFLWEEMVFPAKILSIGGVDTLVVEKKYVDNDFTFTSTDGPKDRATGLSFNFQDIADDTAYMNPEADEIDHDTTREEYMNRTLVPEPGIIIAPRLKKYTFDATTGELTDISYYVFKNTLALTQTWPNGPTEYAQSQGTVQVSISGTDYHYPLYNQTVNGPVSIYVSGSHTNTATIAADSVLPLGNTGETNQLLHNAQEALYYTNRVTTDIPVGEPDPYADRQAAREALATAIWG